MTPMFTTLRLQDVVLRLAVTVVVSLAIGYNRSEHGKTAGMRTTLLVCLAASVAMIQVNILLPTAGRASDSFVMNDLMRLPLGILTGVGLIGGGAILRRRSIIVGVTTQQSLDGGAQQCSMTGVDQPPRQRTNRGSPMNSTYDQTIEISALRGKNHMLRWVIAIAAVLTVGHLLFPSAAMTQTVASAEPTVMVN